MLKIRNMAAVRTFEVAYSKFNVVRLRTGGNLGQ
jgi:hypothetical protein